MSWTTKDIPDLRGRIALVTGANSGLGYQVALQLARNGAHVIMACRNMHFARSAKDSIIQEFPGASLDIVELDLAKLDSVNTAAESVNKGYSRLDILVNNAGIGGFPFSTTTEGIELHFAVNHIGHFVLTGKLLSLLGSTPGARVVSVSSIMHRLGANHLSDINYETRSYNSNMAYGRSKLANLLFANELDRRLKERNRDMLAVTAHPGYTDTNLQGKGPAARNSTLELLMMKAANGLFAQPGEMGATPLLYAAVADSVKGGEYIGPAIMRLWGPPAKQSPSSFARDQTEAQKLWTLSEELSGFRFTV